MGRVEQSRVVLVAVLVLAGVHGVIKAAEDC